MKGFSTQGIPFSKRRDKTLIGVPAKLVGLACLIPSVAILGGAICLLVAAMANPNAPVHPVTFLVGCLVLGGIGLWVGLDARKRGMDGIVWGAATFSLLIIVLPLYLIVRKPRIARPTGMAAPEVDGPTWIRFACPECGKRFKVDERVAGKKGLCSCGHRIRIPDRVPPSSSAVADTSSTFAARRIPQKRYGLGKVGLLIVGAAILFATVPLVVLVRNHGSQPSDDPVVAEGKRDATVEKTIDEPVEETIAAQSFERQPNAPAALWQEIASIPQLTLSRPLSGTSYAEIQRQCERVLATHPELAEVRHVWEQVRFHQKCRRCRGRGGQICEHCNGRGTQSVPDGFTEQKLPVFTGVNPETMHGFEYKGDAYFPGSSLARCNLWFSLYGTPTLIPPPFPDGLLEQVNYLQPAEASFYQCRNCGYYDMPMLVRPFFSDGRRQTEFEAGRLKIRCPKTYVWTGSTGKRIFLRLQEEEGFGGSDANSKFMQPLKTCPNCKRSEYIHREPRMREAACEHCGGSGETGVCPACHGSGIERLSQARELATVVSLQNHLTTGSIHVDFVGETPGFIVLGGGRAQMPARTHLFPGRYRMLLTCYNQRMQPTRDYAVSEEFEIKHHATYASEPLFVLAPEGQGNVKLTKVTKEELERWQKQAKTPVLLKNTLKQTPIVVTLIGKLRHSSVRRTRTIRGGQDHRVYLSPGSYHVLVKYDYRREGRKSEYAKTTEFEIKEPGRYLTEPYFDFTSDNRSGVELTSISEEVYMELNP